MNGPHGHFSSLLIKVYTWAKKRGEERETERKKLNDASRFSTRCGDCLEVHIQNVDDGHGFARIIACNEDIKSQLLPQLKQTFFLLQTNYFFYITLHIRFLASLIHFLQRTHIIAIDPKRTENTQKQKHHQRRLASRYNPTAQREQDFKRGKHKRIDEVKQLHAKYVKLFQE